MTIFSLPSKFLEPPAGKNQDEQSSEDEDDEETDEESKMFTVSEKDGSLIAIGKFAPGEFSCPVVYTRRFPLHWRLQPNAAVKYLTGDALRLFVVHNRPQMFVIERDNSVVYCKIYEEDVTTADHEETSFTQSPVTTPSASQSPLLERKTPASRATGSILSTDTPRELVLEVHGIDLPDWIEQEFVGLVENRLVSHITLNEVQQFFLRNPNSKPTMAVSLHIYDNDNPMLFIKLTYLLTRMSNLYCQWRNNLLPRNCFDCRNLLAILIP